MILLQLMVVRPTGSGRAQNDRVIVSDSLSANFRIFIYETKHLMKGYPMGCACTKNEGIMIQFGFNYIQIKFY